MAETLVTGADAARSDTDLTPIIRLAGVNKWFGAFHVLKDIDLEVARGRQERPRDGHGFSRPGDSSRNATSV